MNSEIQSMLEIGKLSREMQDLMRIMTYDGLCRLGERGFALEDLLPAEHAQYLPANHWARKTFYSRGYPIRRSDPNMPEILVEHDRNYAELMDAVENPETPKYDEDDEIITGGLSEWHVRIMDDFKREKLKYLKSPEWQNYRDLMLSLAGGLCEVEGCYKDGWQLHHLTYERIGMETVDDCIVVCGQCHQDIHANKTTYIERENIEDRFNSAQSKQRSLFD